MTESILEPKPEPISDAERAVARRYSMVVGWSEEDGCYLVTCPELPGLVTHGATVAEAVGMGEEAIATWIAGSRRFGDHLPAPSARPRRLLVDRPRGFDATAVRSLRERLGLTPEGLAELLDVAPERVASWEHGEGSPDGASLRLLEVADRNPEVLLRPLPLPA